MGAMMVCLIWSLSLVITTSPAQAFVGRLGVSAPVGMQAVAAHHELLALRAAALFSSWSVHIQQGLFKPMDWIATILADVTSSSPSRSLVRVAVVSDMNGSYGSITYKEPVHHAVDALLDHHLPSLVLSTGDMVAGMKPGLDYEAMWKAFHRVVTTPLSRAGIPFAPTPGNHDGTNRPGFELERSMYRETWLAHKPDLDFVDDAHYPRRYAFLHEGALFISIDASTVGKLHKTQRRWLERVLAKHDDVPIKIVYGHVPLYPFAQNRESEILADEALEALLVEHNVSLYVSGHHHAYYPGKSAQNGLRLVSMACLGGGPRQLIGTSETSERAYLILELDTARGEIASLEAYLAADFTSIVDRAILPEVIDGGNEAWRIVRDDL